MTAKKTAPNAAVAAKSKKTRLPAQRPPDTTSAKRWCASCVAFRRYIKAKEKDTGDVVLACAVCRKILTRLEEGKTA